MHKLVVWTFGLDARLRALRLEGLTWDQVALEMEMGRNTVLERGRRIGARGPRRVHTRVFLEPKDRPPRPAGHPATWALVTDGTLLAGEPYPFPVFL
jgi:hypothetical protein